MERMSVTIENYYLVHDVLAHGAKDTLPETNAVKDIGSVLRGEGLIVDQKGSFSLRSKSIVSRRNAYVDAALSSMYDEERMMVLVEMKDAPPTLQQAEFMRQHGVRVLEQERLKRIVFGGDAVSSDQIMCLAKRSFVEAVSRSGTAYLIDSFATRS